MKLVYTLGSLATLLATGQAFELNTKNVAQLQAQLESKIATKYNNKARQFRQKRGLMDSYLASMAQEINLNDYNVAQAQCSVATRGFWEDCRQCVAQQCTTYMSRECGSNAPSPAQLQDGRFQQFLASRMADVSPSIPEMNEYLNILQSIGVNAKVDYKLNGEDMELSTRKRRSIGLDCQQFVKSSTNIEVKCSNYDDAQPQNLVNAEAGAEEPAMTHETDDAVFGNWKFSVKASHPHEMMDTTNADGSMEIKLQILPAGDDEEEEYWPSYGSMNEPALTDPHAQSIMKVNNYPDEAYLTMNEIAYPAQHMNGQSPPCPGCMHQGGNKRLFVEENEYNNIGFDCNGNENANCNQMMINESHDMEGGSLSPRNADEQNGDALPCLDEGKESEEIPADYEDELLKLSQSETAFCDSIGGCSDVPFVRRSSRGGRRFERAARAKFCSDTQKMPETCLALGFNCDSCDATISSQCPEYYSLRSELSKKISEASILSEKFQTLTNDLKEEIKFLHALRNGGSDAIYVQSARTDGSGDIELSIHVGSARQAASVLAQAKIKSGEEWEVFSDKVSDRIVELF